MSFILSILVIYSAEAMPPSLICDYKIMGIPFSQVELGFLETGEPEDFVTIGVQGKTHRESFTPVAKRVGERLHGWISQESAENSIEMIVFEEMETAGNSKLINDRVPFGKEIWGNCTSSTKER